MTDYKNSLNLPKTDFPMKASLPVKEPKTLKQWDEKAIYKKIRKQANGKPKFVLHDGPPYANGELHLGHVINKLLKDFILKSKTLSGYDAPYTPGWDCHGLPIEHKVEQKIGKPGVKVDKKTFRKKCREYANKQINIQKEEFKRLGVLGAWNEPYLTMDFKYEANIIRSLANIIKNGHLQRGYKPVFWSVVGQSALAEAEVEYKEKQSNSIYVKYPVSSKNDILKSFNADPSLQNLSIATLIWTTTPWTLPSSQAVCLGSEFEYALVQYEHDSHQELLIVAKELAADVMSLAGIENYQIIAVTQGQTLEHIKVNHPFYKKTLPMILGDHVTIDTGTGCVHTAPDHGVDDFNVGKKYHLETLNLMNDAGVFREHVEYFAGQHVYKVDASVIELLKEKRHLLHHQTISHSYPHCWRTKTPLIFRATPQWFISMTQNKLLEKCEKAIEDVIFTPKWGRKRMESMLLGSPDWCISRQRTWGVPITLFVHKDTYNLHPKTEKLMEQVALRVEKQGIDAWFDLQPSEVLFGEESEQYMKVTDTLDVWFDSGVSHTACIKESKEPYPVDLYVEGSDQHRGWFQSSLKTGIAMHQTAPYKNILTHGFIVDEKGHKMSKSLGNGIAPQDIIREFGADVLRLWASSVDYSTDMNVSKDLFKRISDAYRRIRNTARFLLSNISDFNIEKDIIKQDIMLPLDAWAVERAYHLQRELIEHYEQYNFSAIYQKIYNYCVNDLGGFYLDIIKDRQYTTQKNSLARRSCQTAMYHILEAFVRWIAPVLSFTAEEIWEYLPGDRKESIHLTVWYSKLYQSSHLNYDEHFWSQLFMLREQTNKALEESRKQGVIGGTLEAEVMLYTDKNTKKMFEKINNELRFVLITSKAEIKIIENAPETAIDTECEHLKIEIKASKSKKCIRCWHHKQDVGQHEKNIEFCGRCVENVYGLGEDRQFA